MNKETNTIISNLEGCSNMFDYCLTPKASNLLVSRIKELKQENKQLKKDIKNIIKILDKKCDDLEATEEEFDSLERWQGSQVVELEAKEVSE